MKPQEQNIKTFLARIEKMKANGGVDLSAAEDLSLAVMNLISLEEHFFFTGAKTKTLRTMMCRVKSGVCEPVLWKDL